MKRIATDGISKQSSPEELTEIFGTVRDRLDFYRNEIQCETTTLSERSNAYLGAQSFLIVVYASTMANLSPEYGRLFTLVTPTILALLGIGISAHAWPGIKMSYDIIDHWYAMQTFLLRNEPLAADDFQGTPLFHHKETMENGNNKALAFPMRTPWVFGGLWMLLGSFSVCLHIGAFAG